MIAIDYEKYNHMSRRKLLNSLIKEEKNEEKIKKQMEDKKALICFLKSKLKESLDTPKYYTLENSPALNEIRKWEKENPQEAEEIKHELEEEMKGSYENNNHA